MGTGNPPVVSRTTSSGDRVWDTLSPKKFEVKEIRNRLHVTLRPWKPFITFEPLLEFSLLKENQSKDCPPTSDGFTVVDYFSDMQSPCLTELRYSESHATPLSTALSQLSDAWNDRTEYGTTNYVSGRWFPGMGKEREKGQMERTALQLFMLFYFSSRTLALTLLPNQ